MSKVVVIHLKKNSLEVWAVEDGEKVASAETSWQPENLVDKLKMIKERFQTSSVRVLVADEIAGVETVLNVLAEAALAAKLKIEMGEGGEVSNEQRIVNREKIKRVKKIVMIVGGVVVVIGLIVGGVMVSSKATSEPAEIIITPIASATPTPIPEPLELSELSVEVLNGSGIAGRAGEVKKLLVGVGFSEELIETGNADNYEYEGVEVMLKAGVDARVVVEIGKVLGGEYEVREGGELDENNEYDVVVIVGTKIEVE